MTTTTHTIDASEGDINQSEARAQWQHNNLNTETCSVLKRDDGKFLHQALSTPCLNVLKSCDGIYIEDMQGRKYMDFHGNNVHQVGYKNKFVIDAIIKQLHELPFSPRRYTNLPAIRLAEKLTSLAPGDLNRVLFAPGGTSAIGIALKLARNATGRYKTISMWDSFHGASLDAISIGGEAAFRKGTGPLLPGTEHVPPADPHHCPFKCGGTCNNACADYVDYVLEKEGDVAAVVAETIRSTPYIPPKDYWKKIRSACDKHGALLILDEIPHALGRTGKMFTCEHYDVVPDMLVIGKGLGGGIMPLAAVLAREHLNVAIETSLGHYTHEKSPVACAAALAAIEFIEREHLLAHADELGSYALQVLTAMKGRHRLIGDVRGLGLFLGIELVTDRSTMERACREAEIIMYAALSKGLNFKLSMGNIITLTPSLIISKQELDAAFAILDECLTEVEHNDGN
jgi:4-aminobutyrate aminotransferase